MSDRVALNGQRTCDERMRDQNTCEPFLNRAQAHLAPKLDRIPSTNPGAEPPRDARDSGSARLHSMHLETSSSD